MENGLYHDLYERHFPFPEVANVLRHGGCLIVDGATEFGGQDVGDFLERDGVWAIQFVALAGVELRCKEDVCGDLAYIANVDEGHPSFARRYEQAVVLADVIPVGVT